MTMNERVKEIRKQKGMTQSELSDASGVGRITISRIETGELTNTSMSTVKKIAKGLGVDEIELFSG